MALDFTRLSDVTLVEEATETANVLIEEGGEIKRMPKQEYLPNIGGGFDAIISIDNDTNECTLLHGSYESVRNKMLSGICPSVWIYRTSGMDMYYTVSIVDIDHLSNPNKIAFRIDADNPNTWVRLNEENNEVSYYVYED